MACAVTAAAGNRLRRECQLSVGRALPARPGITGRTVRQFPPALALRHLLRRARGTRPVTEAAWASWSYDRTPTSRGLPRCGHADMARHGRRRRCCSVLVFGAESPSPVRRPSRHGDSVMATTPRYGPPSAVVVIVETKVHLHRDLEVPDRLIREGARGHGESEPIGVTQRLAARVAPLRIASPVRHARWSRRLQRNLPQAHRWRDHATYG